MDNKYITSLLIAMLVFGLAISASAYAQSGGSGEILYDTTATGTSGTGATDNVGTIGTLDSTTTTPGVPNTGAGGDTGANLLLLGIAALALIAGAAYLWRRQAIIRG